MRLTKMFLVLAIPIWIASCATGGDCAWAKRIVTAPEDTMTRATKEQIVAHNRKVAIFCR